MEKTSHELAAVPSSVAILSFDLWLSLTGFFGEVGLYNLEQADHGGDHL